MTKIYDVSDFGLCMVSNVRMFRRNRDLKFFEDLKQVFYKYSKDMSDNTISCSIRDLQPHSIEGEKLDDKEWKSVLPLHDFLFTVLISRKLTNEADRPREWIMSDVMALTECIGGRFKDQAEFDAWARKQDFKCDFPFRDVDPFDMEEADVGRFNALLMNMLEYSAPRYTYMPSATSNLISANMNLLTDETRQKMVQIIDDTVKRFEELGQTAGAWDGYDPCLITLKGKLRVKANDQDL